jgi:hypothetical protein
MSQPEQAPAFRRGEHVTGGSNMGPNLTWDELNDLMKTTYLEGARSASKGFPLDAEIMEFMWECSDALRDLISVRT